MTESEQLLKQKPCHDWTFKNTLFPSQPWTPLDSERFVMTHIGPDSDQLHTALQKGELKLPDLGLLVVMVQRMEPNGRVKLRPNPLADLAGISRVSCYRSLKRLQDGRHIARVYDPSTGGSWFLINPFLFSTGSTKSRGALWAQFKAALENADEES